MKKPAKPAAKKAAKSTKAAKTAPKAAAATPSASAAAGPVSFHTTLLQSGKTATGIKIPPEAIAALGAGKKPPVKVTLNKTYTYRSTVAVMGGDFMVGVNADHRAASGVQGGDPLDVTLELDTAPRELVVPPDFQAALAKDAAARQFFDGLSYSNRRRFVYLIEDAKTPETRARRIEKSVSDLRAGKI